MSTSTNTKKQCVTCNKNGGILICDGCQQIFCSKHVIEHRQKLSGQLDVIMQEHDLLQHEIKRLSVNDLLLQKIDQWEKEYIKKIQISAETSRKNLQKCVDQSKERLSQACHDMAVDICSSREADDYSEHDFIRWKEQLKRLKLESTLPSSLEITEKQKTIVHLITNNSNENQLLSNQQTDLPKPPSNSKIQDKSSDVLNPNTIKNEGSLVKHTGAISAYAYIRGQKAYSTGCHTVRCRLETCAQPYRIFFGCISSKSILQKNAFTHRGVVGWFGDNQEYKHGTCTSNCKKHEYYSGRIRTNDILHVIFDCDNQQIRLFNERLNTTNKIQIDIDKTPFPWQLLMIMYHKNDCVRILTT